MVYVCVTTCLEEQKLLSVCTVCVCGCALALLPTLLARMVFLQDFDCLVVFVHTLGGMERCLKSAVFFSVPPLPKRTETHSRRSEDAWIRHDILELHNIHTTHPHSTHDIKAFSVNIQEVSCKISHRCFQSAGDSFREYHEGLWKGRSGVKDFCCINHRAQSDCRFVIASAIMLLVSVAQDSLQHLLSGN